MEMTYDPAGLGHALTLVFTREELAENVDDFSGTPDDWAKTALKSLVFPFIHAYADPYPLDDWNYSQRASIATFPCSSHYRDRDPLSAWKFDRVECRLTFAGRMFAGIWIDPKGKMSA